MYVWELISLTRYKESGVDIYKNWGFFEVYINRGRRADRNNKISYKGFRYSRYKGNRVIRECKIVIKLKFKGFAFYTFTNKFLEAYGYIYTGN